MNDAQAMFNQQLATYRKIVGENLMYHREVYGLLANLLRVHVSRPFRFLDIACGDASASSRALQGSAITHYYGIDLSAPSLELARHALKVLPCPADLRCADFAVAMEDWTEPVDVAWIGMSLHHLQSEAKARLIRKVHDALSPGGMLLLWEPTLLESETRTGWLARFSDCRREFAPLTDTEFSELESHMNIADYPETADAWMAMGEQAGFTAAEQVYVMPNRFGRVFVYRV